ncbi:CHASE domain-containing protein [Sulfitobacter sp. SK012]|uniref:CHASE domain-containing protein n=1 Tax=Sulfitobacter sp. SK012 TaxID=1389005 RepID=UPI0020C7894F|nr:CHASE domain-containing protein [Sulfitobacter sp. SK012]
MVATAGACLSIILFLYSYNAEQNRLLTKFEITAQQPVLAVNKLIETDLSAVQSIVAFYESSEHVTRQEFKRFASSILSWHNGIQALEWLPNVLANERYSFEQDAELDGLSEFRITELADDGRLVPASWRPEYYPVYYVEPISGNKGAFGFDVMSEPTRRAALFHSRKSGKMTISDPIDLVQKSKGEFGVLVMAPVFRQGRAFEKMTQQDKQLSGFVLAVLQIPDLITAATSRWLETPEFGDVFVFANLGNKGQKLVFIRQVTENTLPDSAGAISGPFASYQIEVANLSWQIVVKPPAKWPTTGDLWLPWSLLFCSLGLTAIASMVYRMRQCGVMQLRRLAASLQDKNKHLEEVSKLLARYLPRQLWEFVLKGKGDRLIGAKRKRLTIFFGDIIGFTHLSHQLQPDDLSFILNDFFSEMSAVGLRHGATLDKYVGDAVVMFFGDPTSDGVRHDAVTCVNMAIEMQHRMIKLRKKWQELGYLEPIHMRIGIHSGTCDVGNFGCNERMSYTIVGSQVNIAARIEKLGLPDRVTITDDTFKLVHQRFQCAPLDEVQLKGVGREVQLYSVIAG